MLRLKETFKDLWSPAILVIAPKDVDENYKLSTGSTIIETLKQVGDLKSINGGVGVPIRTAAERPIRLTSWKLRFFSCDQMVQPTMQESDAATLKAFTANSDASGEALDEATLIALDDSMPWYTAYRQEYLQQLAFGDHETMDDPVACLLVLPSSTPQEELPVRFKALLNSISPPALKQFTQDPSILKHCVILHDGIDSDPSQATAKASYVTSTLGLPCHSVTLPTDSATFIHDLSVRYLIPGLEARIRHLDQIVTTIRRGLRNQLKSLLFRKAATPADGASSSGQDDRPYKPGTPEYQLRQLSDLSLMVGDYDTALSTLKLLATDYKADKAYKHYAAVQEAMAVSITLGDGSLGDAISNFKEAFYRYSLCNAGRYTIRVAMLYGAFLEAINRSTEASWIYMKAHNQENNLLAALLLERAAHCFLRATPTRRRKFAFHLVLAGLRYNQAGQHHQARKVNVQALRVYDGHDWSFPEEHVHESLGKLLREEGQAMLAVDHFAKALSRSGGSITMQRLHLKQFTDALQEAATKLGHAPVLDLPLPVIDTTKAGLSFAGQTSFACTIAHQIDIDEWKQLEAALPLGPEAVGTWLDGGSKANLLSAEPRMSCCVGEDVGVDITLTNPLQIDLAITQLRLVCEFEPAAGVDAPTAPSSAADPPLFHVREERITLKGDERVVVQLRVKPLRQGTLEVKGVAWTLGGIAKAQKEFQLAKLVYAGSRKSRSNLAGNGQIYGNAKFRVLPPMPRLEAHVESLPGTLFVGQLTRCSLRLKNIGSMSLQGITVACKASDMYLEGLDEIGITVSTKQGVAIFTLPPKYKLGVGQEVVLPFYVRPSQPGPSTLAMLWYYEPLIKPEGLKYRTLKASCSFNALPSMQIQASITAAPVANGSYLLQLHALNLQGLDTFQLKEMFLHKESGWLLQPLDAPEASGSKSLPLDVSVQPESSLSLRYYLKPSSSPEELKEDGTFTASKAAEEFMLTTASGGGAKLATEQSVSSVPRVPSRAGRQLSLPFEEGAIDLFVRWEGTLKGAHANGIHSLRQIKVQEGPALQHRLSHQKNSALNTPEGNIPIATLHLEIRNMMTTACSICVDTGAAAHDVGIPNGNVQQLAKKYVWCGPAKLRYENVPAGQVAIVPLSVALIEPGSVVVDDYAISWTSSVFPDLCGSIQGMPCHLYFAG